jgi:ABC-2 type transport system ATP-binding protein
MLRVSHLRKEFTSVVAVDDVSFRIERGEIFGLLGPNGAGKTTTIRMILNILEPDAGEILYDGSPFAEATRNIMGYLPEERGLYRKSTVLDTILYCAALRGMARGAARVAALQWLERFQLRDAAGRRVVELSKGNQQKVQFITTVLHDPGIVILDEPFAGLDPVNQILLIDILHELKDRGKAIIFCTHQMDQAEKLSDSLCLINRGRVVLEGTVADVKHRYGSNSLHVEFNGDAGLLKDLPGVRSAMLYENSAEFDLAEGTQVRAIVELLNPRVALRKVELREPSLHAIFLHAVGGEERP